MFFCHDRRFLEVPYNVILINMVNFVNKGNDINESLDYLSRRILYELKKNMVTLIALTGRV